MLEIPGMICLLDLRTKTVRGERYLDEEARDFANLHGSPGLVLAPCTLLDPAMPRHVIPASALSCSCICTG